ncbi:MAG TPA: S9 family peptidase [Chloroflexota bacterium]|nr:S9 family peptidase [Chloroflexota bacterium]
MDRRPLALTDLLAFQNVSDPQLSPDGRWIAFVVETLDGEANEACSRLWLVGTNPGSVPRMLTRGEKVDSQPRWSPDGQLLAFVSNRIGARQIWLLPLAGGEPWRLTDHPTGVQDPVWSSDGSRLAFVAKGAARRGEPVPAEERDDRRRTVRIVDYRHKLDGQGFFGALRNHLWTIPAAGGPATQLTDGPFDDAEPAWSPDDRAIIFSSDRAADRDRHYGGGALHLVEVATGVVRRLTSEQARAGHASWSLDGKWLAYPGSDEPDEASPSHTRLWICQVATGEVRCLTADLDRSVGQRPSGYLTPSRPVWTADGELLYLLGEGPSTQLVRFGVEPGRAPRESVTRGRHAVLSFSANRDGRRAALLVSDSVTPPEVWLWDAEAGTRQVTVLNRGLLDQLALATPEDLRVTRPDGIDVEGWLLRPPAAEGGAHPLVLSVHGGPHNYFGDVFSFDHQLLAAQGYAVLYVNPRGSGGYTQAFARAVCEDWGGQDYQDLLAMLDHATGRAEPAIDSSRLGITGSSYGGFMTLWAIGQTDRFRAAVSGACISNLISFFGTSDIGASWGERELGGTPYDRLDWYLARSPVSHAARVQTPVLLYHGESDLRCPIEQSEQMFTALRRLGKTVEFLRLPSESHGALNGSPAHRLAGRQAIVDWFANYL